VKEAQGEQGEQVEGRPPPDTYVTGSLTSTYWRKETDTQVLQEYIRSSTNPAALQQAQEDARGGLFGAGKADGDLSILGGTTEMKVGGAKAEGQVGAGGEAQIAIGVCGVKEGQGSGEKSEASAGPAQCHALALRGSLGSTTTAITTPAPGQENTKDLGLIPEGGANLLQALTFPPARGFPPILTAPETTLPTGSPSLRTAIPDLTTAAAPPPTAPEPAPVQIAPQAPAKTAEQNLMELLAAFSPQILQALQSMAPQQSPQPAPVQPEPEEDANPHDEEDPEVDPRTAGLCMN
jgi:hypothetical protein